MGRVHWHIRAGPDLFNALEGGICHWITPGTTTAARTAAVATANSAANSARGSRKVDVAAGATRAAGSYHARRDVVRIPSAQVLIPSQLARLNLVVDIGRYGSLWNAVLGKGRNASLVVSLLLAVDVHGAHVSILVSGVEDQWVYHSQTVRGGHGGSKANSSSTLCTTFWC